MTFETNDAVFFVAGQLVALAWYEWSRYRNAKRMERHARQTELSPEGQRAYAELRKRLFQPLPKRTPFVSESLLQTALDKPEDPQDGYGWSQHCDAPEGPCGCGATHKPRGAP